MDVESLRYVLTLAEELHFGRTAERLGLTTSRASQTLSALERKLGGRPLFERTSRVVTLTAAGAALREDLRPFLTFPISTLATLAVAHAWRDRAVWKEAIGALALTVFYTVCGTVILPRLWEDPLGPMMKVWPILAFNLLLLAIMDER